MNQRTKQTIWWGIWAAILAAGLGMIGATARMAFGQATQPVVVIPASTQPTTLTVQIPATVINQIITPAPAPAPTTRMAIGTNAPPNDTVNGNGAWCDLRNQFCGWYPAAGATGITYDGNGYPAAVQGPGQAACWTYLFGYPNGTYSLSWKGGQTALTIQNKTLQNIASDGSGGWTATVVFNAGDRCEFRSTGGISNVHLLAPDASPFRIFRDAYIDRLRPYRVLRLMPLEHCNGNGLPPVLHTTWAQRVTPTQWDQTGWGPAYEFQAELCRETGCTPWVCLPYGTDDATAVSVAQIFATFPTVILEYGNENWNQGPAFQGNQVRNDAIALGVYNTNDPNVAGARHAATLTARVGKLWKQAIGPNRVKVVFGAQATWNAWASDGLGWLKPGDVDALGIAPYFQPADSLINPTVAQIEASCGKWIDTILAPGIAANAKVAAAFGPGGIPIWAYEARQHLMPAAKGPTSEFLWGGDLTPAEWQAYLADPYRQTQLDPGMGAVCDHLLDVCRSNGMTLFCNFTLNSNWGRSGFWGLTQSITDADGPQGQAIQRAISAGN